MRTLLVLIPFFLVVISCKPPQSTEANDSTLKVLETDRNFNAYCKTHGRSAAFIGFAADSAIQLRDGALPLIGLKAIRDFYVQKSDTTANLSWEPVRAEVSGELAYTFGWWKFKAHNALGKDTIYRGDYVTIWKKQKDSTWKYVLDAGNNTPYTGQ